MGRFGINNIDNYGNSTQSSYFVLKEDGEVANVRFMYNGLEDIEFYAVHEVEVGDKRRYVNCLRAYNEPINNCPLCASHNAQLAKFFIPLYDTDSQEVKIWERGKKFQGKLTGLCARYASSDTPLVAHTFDIERHGKKGDTSTTYEVFETGADGTRLNDLPDAPEVLGTIILDKSFDELANYVESGDFGEGNVASSRGRSVERHRDDVSDRPTGRRTPSNYNRGESF